MTSTQNITATGISNPLVSLAEKVNVERLFSQNKWEAAVDSADSRSKRRDYREWAEECDGHYIDAIAAVTAGELGAAEAELESAARLESMGGDDADAQAALKAVRAAMAAYAAPAADDDVIVETMPDWLRDSHRAAGNWGSYPANGSVRETMSRADAEALVAADSDGYDSIVGPAGAEVV